MITTEVEQLAYDLWEKDGRPDGRDQEYYFTAERMLAGNGNVAVGEAPKKAPTRTSTAGRPKATRTRTKKQA